MAELVLGAFLSVAIEKLASATLNKFARSTGIQSNLKNLNASLTRIQALLVDASHKEQTNESVKLWLNRLQHLAYDIEDILDELTNEAMQREMQEESRTVTSKVRKLVPTCCTSFVISNGMQPKLDEINTSLQDLEKETLEIGLIVRDERPKKITNRKYESCFPEADDIVGREGDKKALLHKLMGGEACKEKFSIVPIVGMGGVGKTTLARLLYNDEKMKDHFQLKAWVCVSDEFDIFFISNVIYQHVTGENKKFTDLSLLQAALADKLSKKRFLIVLDDVWSDNCSDWETLVRPFHSGAHGSKIIMTTRKEELLKKLGYNLLDPVNSLSSEDALSLLAQHALGTDNFDSHPTLKPHGVGIVKKCGCLPLALKALGRLLRKDSDEDYWEEVLNSERWESYGKDESIVPALRLSYDDLSACSKRLFAYCSLFPKDYLFDREELVLLWMAEGFLYQSSSSKSIERWGRECFDELLSRSFFQHAPNEEALYVMHDLMNELATSVAGDFFSRLDIGMKKEFVKDTLEKYRHMSFVCEEYITYKKFNAFKGAIKLRSFLALSSKANESRRKFSVSNKILENLFLELPLLRVLSLSNLTISELPESIGSLKHLRYLNLSHTDITHLPEHVCTLYHLQTLIIFGCLYITELPKSFLKLKSLRHFDIRDTWLLNKMPIGTGELKGLRVLASSITVGEDYVFAVTGLKELTDLQTGLRIEGLQKLQNPMHVQDVNLSQKRFDDLELIWSDVYEHLRKESVEHEVLNVLKPRNDSLKRLAIQCYGGKKFPRWVGDPSFLQLADVSIEYCRKCTSLPPLGQLPSLKKLHIKSMAGVKSVGLESLGTTGPAFPSLKSLSFVDMKGLEVWSTSTSIPCLEELWIEDCPKLVEVSVEALPSLRVLKVSKCSDSVLRSLVLTASSSITRLNISDIQGLSNNVWEGVMEHLGAVEEVIIEGCNEIRCLWESEAEASKVLVKLRNLKVDGCSNLVTLAEKEDEDENENSVSKSNLFLTSLEIGDCNNMKCCCCPDTIEDLRIYKCNSITSISFPTGGAQKLKMLSIHNCKKLVFEKDELGGGERKTTLLINNTTFDMSLIESLSMWSIENLESIVELRSFIHLTLLDIRDCPNVKSFPDHELQNLFMLKELVITNCPMMDVSFPRGLWPPKLHKLIIGGLKKPISEWGPQNFPTSLVNLTLTGGLSEEDGSSWGEISHILPSSITSLLLYEFKNLDSVSVGLQHLTSLQHLSIYCCPKMKDLPKTTLSSLLSLYIGRCPILKERCGGRGSYYWPLISHIPSIQIDN